MQLSGLHLLLTYQCTLQCDHCFAWGSPWQSGTMRLSQIAEILRQAAELGCVESIFFEGGEPCLYYPILLQGVQEAAARGFRVGIVTNAYWATEVEDAVTWLRPLAGLIQDLSVSTDLYHSDAVVSQQAVKARAAADRLDIPVGTLTVAQPGEDDPAFDPVMFRGRAAEELADAVPHQPWETFTTCPYEDLGDPGRVHIDPLGIVHLCQGIALGNLFDTPLVELCATYEPAVHPIVSPLLKGGPAELARHYGFHPELTYADGCHLCYETRCQLRQRFPEILAPDQMYGVVNG